MEKKDVMVMVGNNVRRYRMERGLTQEKLAELLGKNPSMIARIEGGVRMMSLPTLIDMANKLQVSVDALCGKNEEKRDLSNILSLLNGQSEESLCHLERVIRVCVAEYGEEHLPDNTEKELSV